jgi:hypothetical protein
MIIIIFDEIVVELRLCACKAGTVPIEPNLSFYFNI